MKWPAERIKRCREKSFGMYDRAMQLELQGAKLIHLEVGRPDFDTPAHIKEGAKQALDQGRVHYSDFAGAAVLREALARKLREVNGIDASPDEILVTNGLTHAATAVFSAAIDHGDEVILLEPYYPQHIGKVQLAGGRLVTARLGGGNAFRIEREPIEAVITDRTRMISLVNPSNPTGRVYTREELQVIADLAIEYDLLVASDEVYDQITFDGHKHLSIATLPGMWERTFSMYAMTKTFAMDGWRVGYVACPSRFMPALMAITVSGVSHVNTFIQYGALAAVAGPQDSRLEMLAEDDRRRRMVCERLNAIDGVVCPLPEGTIYVFPDLSAFAKPAEQIAEELMDEHGVVTEDGAFYGAAGKHHLRICFGSEPYEVLEEAMDRMESYFAAQSLRRAS